ncbi:MAG TPA: recombinase family protein [Acidimicrobiales bacterium]|nr:recombinase family protein [Acidimicrobiales bacterium]
MARTTRKGAPTPGAPLRALGYVRVSTQDQAESGAGLADQRQTIKAACAGRGLDLLDIIADEGWSASSLDRPGITEALAQLDAGDADALIVSKLDRVTRSLLDFAGLMDRAQRRGWALIALDLGVDTSTAAGSMMASILATFAEFERRLIGERTKAALAQKRAAGVRLGRPQAVPDAVVGRIVAERAGGATLQRIADGLNADGVPTAQGGGKWWPSTVTGVLDSQAARRIADGEQ